MSKDYDEDMHKKSLEKYMDLVQSEIRKSHSKMREYDNSESINPEYIQAVEDSKFWHKKFFEALNDYEKKYDATALLWHYCGMMR